MVLFSAHTGQVKAVLLDNGYLTDVRTAAAGAVAARYMAPARVDTAAVLGAGVQARLQMQAAHLVRPFRRLCVWARDVERARACAIDLAARLEVEAHVCTSIDEALSEAQLVVTATPSREPLIHAGQLHPGLHITAMGADAGYKNEIHPGVFSRLDRLVVDRRTQSERLGELHHALDAGALHAGADVAELAQIVTGDVAGRAAADDITLCDLTGTGVQDTAIAVLAARRADAANAGHTVEN
jgi:ornithine cyclodeaminase